MIAWVIGRGGLLGSAISRILEQVRIDAFAPREPFAWTDRVRLECQISQEVERFAAAVAGHDRWAVYWSAGIGTLSSKPDDLATENYGVAALCDALRSSLLPMESGAVFLASSAGAIYAGSVDPVIDEETIVSPTTSYAVEKLGQEERLASFATTVGCSLFVARLSTLYGVGQSNAKQQGLLTHISRCIVRNEPIRIFVPLDTIRDYIAAEDAAVVIVDVVARLAPRQIVMKVVASEVPTTISEIVSVFKRIARRAPRIVTSSTPLSIVYKRRIQFRSTVEPRSAWKCRTLLIGINQVLTAERQRFAVGE